MAVIVKNYRYGWRDGAKTTKSSVLFGPCSSFSSSSHLSFQVVSFTPLPFFSVFPFPPLSLSFSRYHSSFIYSSSSSVRPFFSSSSLPPSYSLSSPSLIFFHSISNISSQFLPFSSSTLIPYASSFPPPLLPPSDFFFLPLPSHKKWLTTLKTPQPQLLRLNEEDGLFRNVECRRQSFSTFVDFSASSSDTKGQGSISRGRGRGRTNRKEGKEMKEVVREEVKDEESNVIPSSPSIYANSICAQMDQLLTSCVDPESVLSLLVTHRGVFYVQNLITAIHVLAQLSQNQEIALRAPIPPLSLDAYNNNSNVKNSPEEYNNNNSSSSHMLDYNIPSRLDNSCTSRSDSVQWKAAAAAAAATTRSEGEGEGRNEEKKKEEKWEGCRFSGRRPSEWIIRDERFDVLLSDIRDFRYDMDFPSIALVVISLRKLNYRPFRLLNSFLSPLQKLELISPSSPIPLFSETSEDDKISYNSSNSSSLLRRRRAEFDQTLRLLLECAKVYVWAGYDNLFFYQRCSSMIAEAMEKTILKLSSDDDRNNDKMYRRKGGGGVAERRNRKEEEGMIIRGCIDEKDKKETEEEVDCLENNNCKFLSFDSSLSEKNSNLSSFSDFPSNSTISLSSSLSSLSTSSSLSSLSTSSSLSSLSTSSSLSSLSTSSTSSSSSSSSASLGIPFDTYLSVGQFVSCVKLFGSLSSFHSEVFFPSYRLALQFLDLNLLSSSDISILCSSFCAHSRPSSVSDVFFTSASQLLFRSPTSFTLSQIIAMNVSFRRLGLCFEEAIAASCLRLLPNLRRATNLRQTSEVSVQQLCEFIDCIGYFGFRRKESVELMRISMEYLEDRIDEILDDRWSLRIALAVSALNMTDEIPYLLSFLYRKIGLSTAWEKEKYGVFHLFLCHQLQFPWLRHSLHPRCVYEGLRAWCMTRGGFGVPFPELVEEVCEELRKLKVKHNAFVEMPEGPYELDIVIEEGGEKRGKVKEKRIFSTRKALLVVSEGTRNTLTACGGSVLQLNHLRLMGWMTVGIIIRNHWKQLKSAEEKRGVVEKLLEEMEVGRWRNTDRRNCEKTDGGE